MDKKDIYEHLAKIYLDASQKKKKRKKNYPQLNRHLFFIIIALSIGVGVFLVSSIKKNKPFGSEIALVISPDPVKINFHFYPAKKETFNIELNKLNVSHFRNLAFAVKSVNYRDNISLKVEFSNVYREKTGIYITGISNKWKEFTVSLSDFKRITDWSEMQNLTFSVEEWNTKEKKGMVYLDNIRLLK